MEQPIVNPPNPYVGALRVFPGTMVKVSGQPRPNATRLAINFQTGPSLNPRDDLALHLSPCFTPPRIVRNTLRQGQWGLEEAWGNGAIMSPHAPFEFIILCEPDQFKIALNGAHYCEFRHRIPIHEITHLSIDGDVQVERITITSSTSSYQQPAYQPSAPYSSSMPMPPVYPNLPGGPQPTGASGYPAVPQPTGAGGYPAGPNMYPSMPAGPMPTGAYSGASSGYPGGPVPYPSSGMAAPYPGQGQAGAYRGAYPFH